MAMLYELNSPEFFDRALFGNFVERHSLVHADEAAQTRVTWWIHEDQIFGVLGGEELRHFARSFIARSRPFSVVGNMRPSMSSFMMPIDCR